MNKKEHIDGLELESGASWKEIAKAWATKWRSAQLSNANLYVKVRDLSEQLLTYEREDQMLGKALHEAHKAMNLPPLEMTPACALASLVDAYREAEYEVEDLQRRLDEKTLELEDAKSRIGDLENRLRSAGQRTRNCTCTRLDAIRADLVAVVEQLEDLQS